MPRPSPAFPFTENQRRVVSVVLRQVEETADSVLHWLDRKPGILRRVAPDLDPGAAGTLRDSCAELQAGVERLRDQLGLEPAVLSPAHAIYALLSTLAVTLEETQSSALRGYGPVSEEIRSRWDPEVDRLVALLDGMMARVSGHVLPPPAPPEKTSP